MLSLFGATLLIGVRRQDLSVPAGPMTKMTMMMSLTMMTIRTMMSWVGPNMLAVQTCLGYNYYQKTDKIMPKALSNEVLLHL